MAGYVVKADELNDYGLGNTSALVAKAEEIPMMTGGAGLGRGATAYFAALSNSRAANNTASDPLGGKRGAGDLPGVEGGELPSVDQVRDP